jgi:uncharacterized tellurite resistance protein B-like protein
VIGKAVLERIKAFVSSWETGASRGSDVRAIKEYEIAAAALLVEAAQMDDTFDDRERATILNLLTGRFGLTAEESKDLLNAAEEKVSQSSQLYGFTRAVKDAFTYEQRIELVEMLWEVAYTDGELHDYEASLIRRVTGLLQVSDHDSGAARKRALEKLDLKT